MASAKELLAAPPRQKNTQGSRCPLHPPSEPGRRLFPLTALFVVLLMVREEELLLGFATSRPVLKS